LFSLRSEEGGGGDGDDREGNGIRPVLANLGRTVFLSPIVSTFAEGGAGGDDICLVLRAGELRNAGRGARTRGGEGVFAVIGDAGATRSEYLSVICSRDGRDVLR
jgi:hypothetical protein